MKTAAELINKYGTLEKLLKSAHEIKQNKRRESLIENKDKAIISKKLVTLKNDAPIEKNPEEFQLKQINKEKKVLPKPDINQVIQNRKLEKTFLNNIDIKIPRDKFVVKAATFFPRSSLTI